MKPSVGRIVHFRAQPGAEAQAAIITRVWSPTCVNLSVFPDGGTMFCITSVIRDDHATPQWDWPPRVEG